MQTSEAFRLRKVAEADFPTRLGQFRIYGFDLEQAFDGGAVEEAVVLTRGAIQGDTPPLVRIHSQCLTGDVFHSLRCDCRAQLELGFKADLRSYLLPGEILRYFQLTSVRLLSNNPEKVEAVERAGIRVAERIPCQAAPLDSTETYLRTKRTKMGHLLEEI